MQESIRFQDESFSLGRFFGAVARFWWVVIITLFLGLLVGWYLKPDPIEVYEARTTLFVREGTGADPTVGDLSTSKDLAATYGILISTRPVLADAAARIGDEITPAYIKGAIQIRVSEGTQLLSVVARDNDPVLAADIANSVTETFIERNRLSRLAEIASLQQAAQAQGLGDIAGASTLQLAGLNSLQIIERAIPPVSPLGSNPSRSIFLGGIFGLALGLSLSIGLEFFRDVIRSKERFEGVFHIPVLAVLPRSQSIPGFSVVDEDDRVYWESVRFLRANLQFSTVAGQRKVFCVTSGDAGDGKSTVVASLSAAIAQAGHTVAVIDADMRRPTIAKMLSLPEGEAGLSTYLSGMSETANELMFQTGIDNLKIMPSGPRPPNPSELLATPRFKQLLELISQDVEILLIDAPPVLAVSDTQIIAAASDAALFVVDTRKTRMRTVSAAFQSLAQAGSPIAGAVLNSYRPTVFQRYYYGYSSYYQYGDYLKDAGSSHSNGASQGHGRTDLPLRVATKASGAARSLIHFGQNKDDEG
ncbi:MAG: polysaccharide biosynthesis tyrosine autokinase [Chloroflexi bacterium]|nr:polysaccharide biosynthesis tyrosine autokinase [Chloroflexota bacterium]